MSFWKTFPLAAMVGVLAWAGCKTAHPPRRTTPLTAPPKPVFDSARLAEMDAAVQQAIADKMLPGGVLWLERNGAAYHKAYGQKALSPSEEPMTEATIFDAASLTKVVATTPAIMLLVERGQVRLDEPLVTYLPEFKGNGKETFTIRQLLTHTSGLRPDIDTKPPWSGYETAIRLACAEKVAAPPGTAFRYSDINFLLLGEVVRRVSGRNLNEFVAREVYTPLKMRDTGFLPPPDKLARIAPTEKVNDGMLRGTVHDPTARYMGGVAGHAGLFTTAADLARFARMMLNEGELDGVRILKPETVRLMTRVQTPESIQARRGLGWDIDSGYSRPRGKLFPLGSYGHTGFTGTSIWIDPFSRTFWIFLSNRVHPDGKGNVLPLQATLANLAAEAVVGFDFANVPGALPPRPAEADHEVANEKQAPATMAHVLNGIDVLAEQEFAPLRGLRLGLITNHTGRDRDGHSTIDLLHGAEGVNLKALFSPEHGIRGVLDAKVDDSVDQKTGLPIYSLFPAMPKRTPGQSFEDYEAMGLEIRKPRPEQLRDLDALVFDIQDIGCRFYTYITTMGNCLDAAGQRGLKFFVLDRVNPINGVTLDGPVMQGQPNFIGYHPIPVRYGMTAGELARMFNAERCFKADLTVIPVQGWRRELYLDQTDLRWVNPSPNMRSLTAATLYPGIGLLETTALSVGRGTPTPFEIIGAPYIDEQRLFAEVNGAPLAGMRFEPVRFTPDASVFKGQECGGLRILLTEREHCQVVDLGLTLAQILHRLYPEQFGVDKFNHLLRHLPTLEAVRAGRSPAETRQNWTADLEQFKARREKYLLYRWP